MSLRGVGPGVLWFVAVGCAADSQRVAARTTAAQEPAAARLEFHPTPPVRLGQPRTVDFAGIPVSAELCVLDRGAPAMRHASGSSDRSAIYAIAAADDGLFVLDHERKLRRYRREPGMPCRLVLDRSFGRGGLLPVMRGDGTDRRDWFDTVSVDGRGTLYVSGQHAHPRALSGASLRDPCPRRGRLQVAEDGRTAALGERIVALGADTCADTSFWPAHWPTAVGSMLLKPLREGVFAWRFDGGANPSSLHAADGKALWMHPPRMEGKGFGDVRDVESCNVGVCGIDGNARKIFALRGGTVVGMIDLSELLGRSPDWVVDLTFTSGAAFLAIRQDDEAKVQHAIIYELRGLVR